MQNFAKMVILQQQPLFACSRPSKIRGFMAFKRLISSQQQQCTQQCCQCSAAWLHLCCALLFIVWGKGREAAADLKNFSCTFSIHSCSWLGMKSFLLFVGTQEISCESQFHKKKNSRTLFLPSQQQECIEKVQLKSFLSKLLLLPFPCLTQWTAGHSTDVTMLEQADPLSLPLLSVGMHCCVPSDTAAAD